MESPICIPRFFPQARQEEIKDSDEVLLQGFGDSKDTVDNITHVGQSKDNPLRLLTPFILSPGKSMWIASPYVIDSYLASYAPWFTRLPMEIYCPDPIMTRATNNTGLWLMPRAPLLPAFARGWEKLPNELKANILELNLTWNKPISFVELCGPQHMNCSDAYTILDHHECMTPEIADISREIFWGRNEIVFNLGDIRDPPVFDYRFDLIHKVRLEIALHKNHWGFLNLLPPILNRFTVVRNVVLEFCWMSIEESDIINQYYPNEKLCYDKDWDETNEDVWLELVRAILDNNQAFLAGDGRVDFKGTLEVIFRDGHYSKPHAEILEKMEDLIKSRITFQPKAQ